MPLYDYRCTQCGNAVEVRHGFDDTHAEPCPACGGAMSRVFNPAPILFKGSGFYVTDSRSKSDAPNAEGSSRPSESKPAESKPASSEPAA
jgi:putative FmdB family regulatory protein